MNRELRQDRIDKHEKPEPPKPIVKPVELLRGVGGGLDEVALEAIRSMPDWSPGKQRGIPQRVNMKVPFKFKLQ